MRFFWYTECPLCRQGRLLIARDLSSDALYLHCEECEQGWRDPNVAADPSAGFLTLSEEFEMEFPDETCIDERGWARYKLHSFEE